MIKSYVHILVKLCTYFTIAIYRHVPIFEQVLFYLNKMSQILLIRILNWAV